MKFIKFLIIGVLFGIFLDKAEVISWFRIQEMFRFQAIHMYGIIGLAVLVGVVSVQLIKRFDIKSIEGSKINLEPKPFRKISNFAGGAVFGLGWAMTGACPGPLYTLIGSGYSVIFVVILSALLGTYVYGLVRDKLPH